jgi:hypothetical protein
VIDDDVSCIKTVEKEAVAVYFMVWQIRNSVYYQYGTPFGQFRLPRGPRRGSAAAHSLGLWVCCECCVSSCRSLCDRLITRPGESYILCVCVCVWLSVIKCNSKPYTCNEEVETCQKTGEKYINFVIVPYRVEQTWTSVGKSAIYTLHTQQLQFYSFLPWEEKIYRFLYLTL